MFPVYVLYIKIVNDTKNANYYVIRVKQKKKIDYSINNNNKLEVKFVILFLTWRTAAPIKSKEYSSTKSSVPPSPHVILFRRCIISSDFKNPRAINTGYYNNIAAV